MIDTESEAWRQTRLLVEVLPFVAAERCFALKGGTAINLFEFDLPRLSVDIDLVYLPAEDRATALAGIEAALKRIRARLQSASPPYEVSAGRTVGRGPMDTLQVRSRGVEVKIEVNPVIRQVLYPVCDLAVLPRVEAMLGYARVRVQAREDLFAGKLVAALDRQHPRDLFDVGLLLDAGWMSDELFRAFLAYLVGHKGVIAHLVEPRFADADHFARLYEAQFRGMADRDPGLDRLRAAWERMVHALRARLGARERRFLLSLKRRAPEWDLLGLPGAADWPAIRWKMHNLERMGEDEHRRAVARLEQALERLRE